MLVYEEKIAGDEIVKKIAYVTGSRADYGIVRRYLDLMNKDKDIQLDILATGALLSDTYGHQVELIYADGFNVAAEIEVKLDSSSNRAVLHTMAETLDKFAEFFQSHPYDLLIILGDRYEMLSVATAAAMQRIPILHIHGGEATYGNYDEFIRHAITKMGLYHFTATEEYRQRVIQLGEHPDKVSFTELVHTEDCGQVSINISKPGITKGQHWHNSKWELFIVVAGHGLIQERNINTGETVEFEVSGDKIEAIHMIPGWTHNIINLSETENLVTVMTCNEIFDPKRPDTFFEIV